LKRDFPEVRFPKAHVDLRFFGRSLGLRGGQKIVEQEIGLARSKNIEEISGEAAPLLWHEYRMGDRNAATRLIEYNHADVEGMKYIFDECLTRLENKEISCVNSDSAHRFSKIPAPLKFETTGKKSRGIRPYVPRFPGKSGPKTTYDELAHESSLRDLRIVGIDLTGSERRPSGWCSLVGANATTQRLNTDLEIFVETMNVCPDLVSIDSPLSMPKGRTRVTDDDPVRDEFGIVRACEHQLFARGVNVYPSLIPSMQQLTARGIRLAAKFREAGIPVIESYPGAAQDIMAIPRKRAGTEYLTKGLWDFGVDGEFKNNGVSHDELDAITSAIVGLFFWSGKFEALGNDDEDFLIIPDLENSTELWRQRRVIGFSGPIAAGKTTAGRYIERKGFRYIRYSQVLEDLLLAQGKEVSRESLQEFGEQIHKHPGQRWLSKQLAQYAEEDLFIVIDGIRFPEDHAFMVEVF
jgi:predicted nuclease with RNAse H fold